MKSDRDKIAEDQVGKAHIRRAVVDALNGDWLVRPDEAFNGDPNVTVDQILRNAGWTDPDPREHEDMLGILGGGFLVSPDGQPTTIQNPVKIDKATTGLEPGAYTKADLLRVLENGGDLLRTLRWLRDNGYGRSADPAVLPSPSSPALVAEEILDGTRDERTRLNTLRFWRGRWWRWIGPHYVEVDKTDVRSMLWRITAHAVYINGEGEAKAWNPNRFDIANLYDALQAFVTIPSSTEPGDCIEDFGCVPSGGFVIPMKNGILHVNDRGVRTLLQHTPAHFNINSIPYDFRRSAGDPVEWLKFLKTAMCDDDIKSLQEWFGYLVSGDTSLQKACILKGPPRCGKGTILRAAERLVGKHNTFATTAGAMVTKHGLAGALGKTLGVLGDAFFGKDTAAFVELFKGITGEDPINVEEKYKNSVTVKLGIRFMIAMNQDATFTDQSSAAIERFRDSCTIEFAKSFAGQEDLDLGRRLAMESPEIFAWALDGLDRLNEQRRLRETTNPSQPLFTTSESSKRFVARLDRRAAPVKSFLLDVYTKDLNREIRATDLHAQYTFWCDEHGFRDMDAAAFGAAFATVCQSLGWSVERVRREKKTGKVRDRWYVYTGLREL